MGQNDENLIGDEGAVIEIYRSRYGIILMYLHSHQSRQYFPWGIALAAALLFATGCKRFFPLRFHSWLALDEMQCWQHWD